MKYKDINTVCAIEFYGPDKTVYIRCWIGASHGLISRQEMKVQRRKPVIFKVWADGSLKAQRPPR